MVGRYEGRESKLFSPCMFLYLISVIPSFWILELKTPANYKHTWVIKVLQQVFYVITILLRWWMPKYKCTRDEHTYMIIFVINIASDSQELQSNVGEIRSAQPPGSPGHNHQTLISAIFLLIWTWSLPLFCISVLDDSLDGGNRVASRKNTNPPTILDDRFQALESTLFYRLLKNFYCKFFYILLLIDLPYLILRVISKIWLVDAAPPDISFFIGKNAIQIVVGVYRVLCRVSVSKNKK